VVDGEALFREAAEHHAAGRPAQALALFDRLVRLKPDHADAWNDRGNALDALRRREEALASYERALAIDPAHRHARNGRANMLQAFGRLDEAIVDYQAVLDGDPQYVHAWNGLGNTWMAMNRHEQAIEAYQRARAIRPDHPDANFNEGLARLSLGDFENGWPLHEWRWELPFWRDRRRGFSQPLWTGREDLAGRRVLLHAEQGFGDTLQFCRYVPRVAALGAEVLLEVQPALRALMASLPGVHTLLSRGDALPPFDVHCPLLSLPLAFGTRLQTIPPACPDLAPPADRVAHWRERLGPATRARIGLVWQGNPGHDNDRNRSMRLSALRPLFELPVDWVSLQRPMPAADREAAAALPFALDLGEALTDFVDTAAVVSLLDGVVAVDTAVAHVAGALGRPGWLLLPWVADWRWMRGRGDSPWYPAMRLLRQPAPGAWDPVVDRLVSDLARWGEGRPSTGA
jgi:tetratricopeptide (TPR) repeat protein